IDIDAFRDRWYVTSIAKCYPGRAQGSSVDRPPSRSEIEAWTPFLLDELQLVAPRLVLLVGGTAHRFAFGPRVKLDGLVGRELGWRHAPGASVLCLPHPSGASTWLNDPSHVELWRAGIGLLRDRWAELD
ncbi:MAG: uracil-DNA glycosylase family protein, partial [Candidatus Limnocylindria bacterium]